MECLWEQQMYANRGMSAQKFKQKFLGGYQVSERSRNIKRVLSWNVREAKIPYTTMLISEFVHETPVVTRCLLKTMSSVLDAIGRMSV